jgi:secreted trypsin-like serine protease
MRRAVLLAAALGAWLICAPQADAVPARAAIVGGTLTTIGTAPWQVFLAIGDDAACGGSVLGATHVLTAAHCVVPAGRRPRGPPPR